MYIAPNRLISMTRNLCTTGCVALRVMFFICSFLCTPLAYGQTNAETVTLMGRNALSVDDYLTAIKYFNQAIEAKPYLSYPYYYRAYAKFTLEDYQGAEADCDKSIQLNPFIHEVYQFRGLCRINNNNYQGAIEDYSKVLQETPADQASRFNRALCFLQLKEYQKADSDLDYILAKWPKYYRTYMVKAQSLFEQKDTAQAICWIDSLLQKNPKEGNAWSIKGRYAFEKEKYALADSCFTQAIQLTPNNFNLFISRALSRHSLGKFDLSIADYNRAIELVPEHFVAHYNRGLLRSFVGDYNRAIEDFNFVLSVEPDNDLALYNRAQLYAQTGDYRGAIKDYTQLIHKYPNFSYGYFERANCRRKIGDNKGAIQDETILARQNLDLAYGKKPKNKIQKVRTRSEHELDQYQQLIDIEQDTTRNVFGTLYGKVQNEKVSDDFLPMYHLAFSPVYTKGYHAVGFLPEIARIEKINACQRRFGLTAETEPNAAASAEKDRECLSKHPASYTEFEKSLMLSAIASASYDYTSALNEINRATLLDSTSVAALIQRASILYLSVRSATLEPKEVKSRMSLAFADLKRAEQLAPANTYVPYNMGCLYLHTHQLQEALHCFDRAISLDEKLPEAYYNRGLVHLQLNDKDKAYADFSRAGQLGLYKAYAQIKKSENNRH